MALDSLLFLLLHGNLCRRTPHNHIFHRRATTTTTENSLCPVPVSGPSSYQPIPHAPTEFLREESRSLFMPFLGKSQTFPLKPLSPERPKVVNALQFFKQPHRATRPDHIVINTRELPGNGKSYFAGEPFKIVTEYKQDQLPVVLNALERCMHI